MIKILKQNIKNPLIWGSFLMILGSNLSNFLNYIYHFLMGRMLGPANYGDLAALISLLNITGMVVISLNLMVTKFSSSAKNTKELKVLYGWFFDRFRVIGISIFILFSITSLFIASYLKISNYILIIFSASSFLFMLPLSLNRAFLQGLLKFKESIISLFLENFVKLLSSLLLVYLGFSVFGAIGGILIAIIVGYIISRYFLLEYLGNNGKGFAESKKVWRYFVPVCIQSISITSLYTTDIILVKHFFSPHEAGIYAAVSTLGRIIYFGASPISQAMFPIISKKHASGQQYKKTFFLSLLLTIIFCLSVLGVYTLLPVLSVDLLFGKLFLQASGYIFAFGVFISLFTIASLFINYYLSLGKTKIIIFPAVAAILQIIGIYLNHKSINDVIIVSIMTTALLLFGLIAYMFFTKNKD